MDLTDVERVKTLGKELGYKNDDLRNWVETKSQEIIASKALEAQRKKEELEIAKSNQEQEFERRKVELELSKVKAETETALSQQREKEYLAQEKMLRAQTVSDVTPEASGELNSSINSTSRSRDIHRLPRLPVWNIKVDPLDAFLTRFERHARLRDWPENDWSTHLSAYLQGPALEVYNRLPEDDANKYDNLKADLFKRFLLTEEEFRLKFRSAKLEDGERYIQMRTRLEKYQTKWIELSGGQVDKETSLWDLNIKEQLVFACPSEVKQFIKEQGKTTSLQAAEFADRYIEAHDKKRPPVHLGGDKERFASQDPRSQPNYPRDTRECRLCGRRGHVASNCRSSNQGRHTPFQNNNRNQNRRM